MIGAFSNGATSPFTVILNPQIPKATLAKETTIFRATFIPVDVNGFFMIFFWSMLINAILVTRYINTKKIENSRTRIGTRTTVRIYVRNQSHLVNCSRCLKGSTTSIFLITCPIKLKKILILRDIYSIRNLKN